MWSAPPTSPLNFLYTHPARTSTSQILLFYLMKGIRPLYQPILQSALHLRGFYRPLPIASPFITVTARRMSSQREDSIPHELRTAAEPRQNRLYPVRLSHVEQINSSIRLLQLAIPQENYVCLRLSICNSL